MAKHSLSSILEEEEADTSGEVGRTPVRQGHREDTLTRVKSKPTSAMAVLRVAGACGETLGSSFSRRLLHEHGSELPS